MSHIFPIKASRQEVRQVMKITGLDNEHDAMTELVMLAGRGEIRRLPSKAAYAAALKESMRDEAAGRMRTFKTAGAATAYYRRKLGK